MGIKERIHKWLGIEQRIIRLENLECWSLRDVADKLSECYVILGNNDQVLADTVIEIPSDKKGVLAIGKRITIQGCWVKNQSSTPTAKEVEE